MVTNVIGHLTRSTSKLGSNKSLAGNTFDTKMVTASAKVDNNLNLETAGDNTNPLKGGVSAVDLDRANSGTNNDMMMINDGGDRGETPALMKQSQVVSENYTSIQASTKNDKGDDIRTESRIKTASADLKNKINGQQELEEEEGKSVRDSPDQKGIYDIDVNENNYDSHVPDSLHEMQSSTQRKKNSRVESDRRPLNDDIPAEMKKRKSKKRNNVNKTQMRYS